MVVLQQRWRQHSSMLAALRRGDAVALEVLLEAGLDCDTTFRLGGGARPALCLAVEQGNPKLVKMLLER